MGTQALDVPALRDAVGPGSPWAKANGQRVIARRDVLGLTVRQVAQFLDVPVQTIYRIESGENTGRDYLRFGLAHVLVCSVDELFPPLDREAIAEFMDDAEAVAS